MLREPVVGNFPGIGWTRRVISAAKFNKQNPIIDFLSFESEEKSTSNRDPKPF